MYSLFLVSTDPALRARFLAHVDTAFFTVTELDSLADVYSTLRQRTRLLDVASDAVILIEDAVPQGAALRDLAALQQLTPAPTLFALQTTNDDSVPVLVAIGVQDVLSLDTLTALRLRDVVTASIVRDRTLRSLRRQRNRALLTRDIVAALVGAHRRLDIVEIALDGLVALEAVRARFWCVEQDVIVLTAIRGDAEPSDPRSIRTLADDPLVVAAVDSMRSQWAPVPQNGGHSARGVLPIKSAGQSAVTDVIELAFDVLPSEEETLGYEQLAVQVGEALHRARLQADIGLERDADRRLMGAISHDLRSPLNTIQLASEMLGAECTASEQRELIDMVQRSVISASHLTQDLLTFTRIAQNRLDLLRKRADVFDIVKSSVDAARLRASEGRSFRLTLQDDRGGAASAVASVDEDRIRQALGNLLSNALTYSPPHSAIEVSASMDSHAIYIDVENDYADAELSDISALFSPGRRLSDVAEKGSLGLGLFIVERILQAHGGRVWVEAPRAHAVRFSMQLPLSEEREPSGQIDLREQERRPQHSLSTSAPIAVSDDMRRLLGQLGAGSARHFLTLWMEARAQDAMPHPLALDRRRLLPLLPDIAHARVLHDAEGDLLFRWIQTGPRLERLLHGTLSGQLLEGGESSWSSQHYAAYARCVAQRAPVYDYLRQRGEQAFSFERLILPLSRDGGHEVTEVLALVVFS